MKVDYKVVSFYFIVIVGLFQQEARGGSLGGTPLKKQEGSNLAWDGVTLKVLKERIGPFFNTHSTRFTFSLNFWVYFSGHFSNNFTGVYFLETRSLKNLSGGLNFFTQGLLFGKSRLFLPVEKPGLKLG